MAAFLELWNKRGNVLDLVCEGCREAEKWRQSEYSSAIKIQSWFRGCQVRAYIQNLRKCAIMIQKTYRGYLGRKAFREYLKQYFEELQYQYYNQMAAIIQATWRGYYVRKYVFDYYEHKRYLNELVQKNEAVRSQLEEYRQHKMKEQLKRDEEIEKLRSVQEATRYHYMLSTESSCGVFMGPNNTPLPIEKEMRSIRFYKPDNKIKLEELTKTTPPQRFWLDKPSIDLTAADGDCRLRHSLPPINKPQGPFKTPKEVWHKRRNLLHPSLRVGTSFNSVERARLELKLKDEQKIVVEEKFRNFSRFSSLPCRQPVFGLQSCYDRPEYGNKHFRNSERHPLNNKQRFHTVVPPITLFDQL